MTGPFQKSVVCPVLIDRVTDLATLQSLIDQAKSGRGQVVLLSGEAGIGKSRLVAEAKTYATAQDFLLLQGQCFPTDRSCPYAPLLDLLRTHLATSSREHVGAEMGSLASALSPLLPDLLPLSRPCVKIASCSRKVDKCGTVLLFEDSRVPSYRHSFLGNTMVNSAGNTAILARTEPIRPI